MTGSKIFSILVISISGGFLLWISYTETNIKTILPSFNSQKLKTRENKTIVLYTSFFGERPWLFVHEHQDYTKTCGCDFNSCRLTYTTSEVSKADAVLFHARNMPGLAELDNLNKVRKPNQKWIYFIMENPRNAPDVWPLDKYFDWTLTYRLSSDFRTPYARHMRIIGEKPALNVNYAQGKTKQVAWFVSNCNHKRDKLVFKLEEFGVQVSVGGACANKFPHQIQCSDRDCKDELRKHRFYFAAENGLCEDYITEKYWYKSSEVNTIPIVLGGSNYFDSRLAIPGSFIDPFDFENPKKLANHLQELTKNDTMFNSYFKWKTEWKLYGLGRGCEEFMCHICTKLHEKPLMKSRKLSSQINRQRECNPKEAAFSKWLS